MCHDRQNSKQNALTFCTVKAGETVAEKERKKIHFYFFSIP
jgi:hypothetical protein